MKRFRFIHGITTIYDELEFAKQSGMVGWTKQVAIEYLNRNNIPYRITTEDLDFYLAIYRNAAFNLRITNGIITDISIGDPDKKTRIETNER